MTKELKVKDQETSLRVSKDTLMDFLVSSGTSKKLSEEQKHLFIQTALINKLNPFKQEIYAMAYKNKFNPGKYDLTIVVAYMVYVERAEDSGLLKNYKCVYDEDKFGKKAICTIWRKDKEDPFVWEVYLQEYTTGTGLWRNKPITMLKKVAISQAFRLFFSKTLHGMPYTKEEMYDVIEGTATVYKEEPKRYAPPSKQVSKPSMASSTPPVSKPGKATIDGIVEGMSDTELSEQVKKTADLIVERDAPFNPELLVHDDCKQDPLAEYERKFKFPLVQTQFSKDLDFHYQYEDKGLFFDFTVPLNAQLRKGLSDRRKYLVTKLFADNQEHDGIPLVRGFLAALSGEPRTTWWTRQNMQAYKNNLTKLHRAAGNTSFTTVDEYEDQFINAQFIEFAKKLATDQIKAQDGLFLYKDERIPLKTSKAIVSLYMDYFIPLPKEDDPTFKTYAQFRQTLSGGSKGMKDGTSMYDGKITKTQANRFLSNLQLSMSGKQEVVNKIFAGGGWNLFGLPKLNPTNRNIVRPLLATLCKLMQARFQ